MKIATLSASRRFLEGDLIAKTFETANKTSLHRLLIALVEVIGSQVLVRFEPIKNVIDNHNNAVGNCNNSFLFASTTGQSMVLSLQIGILGVGCSVRGSDKGMFQPEISVACLAAFSLPSTLVVSRAQCRPGRQTRVAAKSAQPAQYHPGLTILALRG